MNGLFFLIAYFAIPLIVLWWAVTSVNRITHGIGEIAATLRRIEQNGKAQ